jgi:putative ABC transport system permease protein
VDTLIQDVKFALRSLGRAKAFTAVVMTVMALGIGVNVTVFSMVYGFLYRPWPIPDSNRAVAILMTMPRRHYMHMGMSWQSLFAIRDRSKSFSEIGGGWENNGMVTIDRDPEKLEAFAMTSGVLPALGVLPEKGRNFTRDEETWGRNWTQVIISDRIWHSRYHGDPNVLGRTLRLNGRVREVVGIMPPNFGYPESSDFWIPAGFDVATDHVTDNSLRLIGRLKPGVTIAQADAEVKAIMAQLTHDRADMKEFSSRVIELKEREAENARPFVLFLQYAVVFVLLIAAANVANLMLARAAGRRREIALRMAMGATRGRIVRQLLTESLIISLSAGALGVLIGHWGNKLWPLGIPLELPFYLKFAIDGPVLVYTALISVLSAVMFGLAPALHASGENFTEGLRDGAAQAGSSRGGQRLRSAFVVAEVALSLVLLIGAGLMLRSLQNQMAAGSRLKTEGAVTGRVLLPIASYPNEAAMRGFLAEYVRRLRSQPGISEVGGASILPLARDDNGQILLTPAITDPAKGIAACSATMMPGTFHLIGMRIEAGREFSATDDERSMRVAIVNRSLARKLTPDGNALGQRIRAVGAPDSVGWLTVVGIAEDLPWSVDSSDDNKLGYWTCEMQDAQQAVAMVVRSDGGTAAGAAALRNVMRSMDPNLPVMDIRSLHEEFRYALWVRRLLSAMVGIMAVMALVIAGVGLYGVVAYSVSQRTREIGIRMALGADAPSVVRMVVGQSLRLTLLGLGIGLVAAFGLTRFLSAVIAGVSPTDPPTFAIVSVTLALSGVLAASVPAARAARVDPMVALRCD